VAARSSGRPTMNDVAADAGVSLKTVSRVVNNVTTVDPKIAETVLSSIRKLGFRRNDVAAGLRAGGGTKTIGLLTADLANTFYTTLASAVVRVARVRGFQVIMASTEDDAELEQSLALDLCQRRVSGLIVVPTSSDHGYLTPEVERGIAVVFVDRPGSGLDADTVMVDNRDAARRAVEQLVAKGHRRIGLVMDSSGIYTFSERLTGAREAIAAAGLEDDPALVSDRAHSPEDAAVIVGRMLDLDRPPTAALCGNNRATIGVVEELGRRGVALEVVGFDDFEMSRLLPQTVTIVDFDTVRLGTLAAERLLARIDGARDAPSTTLLPTHLVTRGGASSFSVPR
jgi:LacI family transcriptional regulator